jgi:phosphate butyryltransferase
MVTRSFDELQRLMRQRTPIRVAVAGADDGTVLSALAEAVEAGLVRDAVLVGNAAAISERLPRELTGRVRLIDATDPAEVAAASVAAIRSGEADVLAKGNVDSAAYLRAIVARETGIRASGVLSNVTLAEMPSVPRLIGATDNGIIPLPTMEQKRAILMNARVLYAGLGIRLVHAAAIAASEKVSDNQPATTDAAQLAKESHEGAFPGMVVDGPFGYDVALSRSAAEVKHLDASPVAGQADLILFPNLEAGNATVKSWKLHGQGKSASIVLGATVPVLLNSRSDDAGKRFLGLLLAQAVIEGKALTEVLY